MRKSYFPGYSSDFLSWQRLGVGVNNSYVFFSRLTRFRIIPMIISVDKIVEKRAKRIKGYLRLRGVVQLEQIGSTGFLSSLLGGLLGGFLSLSGSLGSFMIVLFLPEIIISLCKSSRMSQNKIFKDEGKMNDLAAYRWCRVGFAERA